MNLRFLNAPIFRRSMVPAILAFAFGIGLGLVPDGHVAYACSCAPPPPPAEALAEADAVFHGTVVGMEVPEAGGLPMMKVTLAVHDVWKGIDSPTVTLETSLPNGANCGFFFEMGERYIVYAYEIEEKGALTTNICTRSRPYDAQEAEALGPPELPDGAGPPQDPPPAGCPRCAQPKPPLEAMEEAGTVFAGEVAAIRNLGPDENFDHIVTFNQLRYWKGPTTPEIQIRVPWSSWFCERQWNLAAFQAKERYIVYAYEDEGALSLRLCSRTALYDEAEARELGDSRAPERGDPPEEPEPEPCPPCAAPRDPKDWLEEAEAAFYGKVIEIEELGPDGDWARRVSFEASEVWKGPVERDYWVLIDAWAWHCSHSFSLDEEAFIFAEAGSMPNLYRVSICFGVVDVDPREALGPGTEVPAPGTTPDPLPPTPEPEPGEPTATVQIAPPLPVDGGTVYLPMLMMEQR